MHVLYSVLLWCHLRTHKAGVSKRARGEARGQYPASSSGNGSSLEAPTRQNDHWRCRAHLTLAAVRAHLTLGPLERQDGTCTENMSVGAYIASATLQGS